MRQTRIALSNDPEANLAPGLNDSTPNNDEPSSVVRTAPVLASQTIAVPSPDPLVTLFLSGEKHTYSTTSVCFTSGSNTFSFLSTSQMTTALSAPPLTARLLSGDMATKHMFLLCPSYKCVLLPVPDCRVQSSEPVTTRLPSLKNAMALTIPPFVRRSKYAFVSASNNADILRPGRRYVQLVVFDNVYGDVVASRVRFWYSPTFDVGTFQGLCITLLTLDRIPAGCPRYYVYLIHRLQSTCRQGIRRLSIHCSGVISRSPHQCSLNDVRLSLKIMTPLFI